MKGLVMEKRISTSEVLPFVRGIIGYLESSYDSHAERYDEWCLRQGNVAAPSFRELIDVLKGWVEEQPNGPQSHGTGLQQCLLNIPDSVLAFLAGIAAAIIFFLPEILGFTGRP